nr:restriction endonuclease subunit S [uncultured Marinifilum sp.]
MEVTNFNILPLGKLLVGIPEYGANASAINYDGINPRYLRITDIDENGNLIENGRMAINKSIAKPYILKENDLVIARTGNTVGKNYLYSANDGVLAYAGYLIKFPLNNKICNPKFVFHFLQSSYFKKWINRTLRTGAQPNINAQEYINLDIPFPSLATQNKIAEILSTTDEVIEQTRALIEKYKSIKKGMLHDLFTCGIDPKTNKLRPTIEQAPELYHETKLGWIPKDWLSNPVENTASLIVSNVDKKSFKHEIPVLLCNYMDVYNNNWITYDLRFMSATATMPEINKFQLLIDDVIFTKDSETPEDIAVPSVVEESVPNLICGYHLGILRPFKSKTSGKFLMYLLHSEKIKKQFIRVANGSTRYGLTKDSINKVLIPYPSFKEQKDIAKRLEAIDKKIETEQSYLDKTQKIKQGLMQDLLTGNVPV